MTFEVKSSESMAIAEHCRNSKIALSTGVSRAYYAAYQMAKGYLIRNGVTETTYVSKADKWNVNLGKYQQFPFAHETIWKLVKGHMSVTRRGEGLRIAGMGEQLHKIRIDADYHETEFSVERLESCIRQAKNLIGPLSGA
jgi:hypothetical protein